MAFVPLPVQKQEEEKDFEWKRLGYRLMDDFFTSNDWSDPSVTAFLSFLIDKVGANIIESPEDPKFRRLKKSSKGFAVVKNVKLGGRVMDFLGFRDVVEEFQEWSVLRVKDDEPWLDNFKAKLELIRSSHRKRQDAATKEAQSAQQKEKEKADYKAQLIGRINEQRSERNK